jgi:zinc protease
MHAKEENRAVKLQKLKVMGWGAFFGLWLPWALALDVQVKGDSSGMIAQLVIGVREGYTQDIPERQGLTAFMARMLLRGTQSRTKDQFDQAIDALGADVATEVRANALLIRASCLVSQLKPFLDLLEEAIARPKFDQAEIARLKAQVISEILESQEDDSWLAHRKFFEFLFGEHPFAQSAQGKIKTVESFTGPHVEARYRAVFVPQNMFVLANLNQSKQLTELIDAFSAKLEQGLFRSSVSKIRVLFPPQNPVKSEIVLVDKPNRTQAQVVMGQVGLTYLDAKFFPYLIGNEALGGGPFNSRLGKKIRVEKGYSYSATSFMLHANLPYAWMFDMAPANKVLAAAVSVALQESKQIATYGITDKEFTNAKQTLQNSAGFRYNTPLKRLNNVLWEMLLGLPGGFMSQFEAALEPVTLEMVNQALAHFLKPDQWVITIVATAKEVVPLLKAEPALAGIPIRVVKFDQE